MKLFIVIGCVLFFFVPELWAQDDKDAFFIYCGGCHTMGNGKLVGPDLKNVNKKYTDAQLLKWIRAAKYIQIGDSELVLWRPLLINRSMPDFYFMKEEDVLEIVNYIKKTSDFNWIGPQPYHLDTVNAKKDTSVSFHFHKQKHPEKAQLNEQSKRVNLFWTIYWLFFGF